MSCSKKFHCSTSQQIPPVDSGQDNSSRNPRMLLSLVSPQTSTCPGSRPTLRYLVPSFSKIAI
eukprot:12537599-Prorocentrum_lima.AAC.1